MLEPFEQAGAGDGPELFYLKAWTSRYPELTAGFTGRSGGVSAAPYQSLNCGLHVGDNPESVIMNRRLVADAIGIPLHNWTYGEQVHGCDVQSVERKHAGCGTESRETAFAEKDAFITGEKGICLAGLFADCVPVYFYDPVHEAVGLAHAGWKGTVLQVVQKTVSAMQSRFGTKPEELLGAVGPSIGPCCYEVDDTVISRVRSELGMKGEPAFTVSENGRYKLNLQEINRQIMIKAGILPSHIEITTLCTGCGTDHFFSHRKENGRTGRMAAWIGLKPAGAED